METSAYQQQQDQIDAHSIYLSGGRTDKQGFFFWGAVDENIVVQGSFGRGSQTTGTINFIKFPVSVESFSSLMATWQQVQHNKHNENGEGPIWNHIANVEQCFQLATGNSLSDINMGTDCQILLSGNPEQGSELGPVLENIALNTISSWKISLAPLPAESNPQFWWCERRASNRVVPTALDLAYSFKVGPDYDTAASVSGIEAALGISTSGLSPLSIGLAEFSFIDEVAGSPMSSSGDAFTPTESSAASTPSSSGFDMAEPDNGMDWNLTYA